MTPDSLLIEPHYFPSIEYVCAVLGFDKLILEKHEHYVKQTYRNRCYIMTAHGIDKLVVPVTGKHGKVAFKDVRIDFGQNWKNNQWRTIQSAYAKAPFFEHYSDDLNRLIYTDFQFLFDLNHEFLSLCLRNLGLKKEMSETVTYEKGAGEDIFDLRSQIADREGTSVSPFFKAQPYYQVFGKSFEENLSIIDLLFSEGPRARSILSASGKKI
jgi:WbqC-like protein family